MSRSQDSAISCHVRFSDSFRVTRAMRSHSAAFALYSSFLYSVFLHCSFLRMGHFPNPFVFCSVNCESGAVVPSLADGFFPYPPCGYRQDLRAVEEQCCGAKAKAAGTGQSCRKGARPGLLSKAGWREARPAAPRGVFCGRPVYIPAGSLPSAFRTSGWSPICRCAVFRPLRTARSSHISAKRNNRRFSITVVAFWASSTISAAVCR
jgi:hypothetical protein